MFALVRYQIDEKTGIIPVNNITNFAPEVLMDFNTNVYCDASWTRKGNTKGSFYLTKILHLGGEKSRFR